jgi:hypothetical protein
VGVTVTLRRTIIVVSSLVAVWLLVMLFFIIGSGSGVSG